MGRVRERRFGVEFKEDPAFKWYISTTMERYQQDPEITILGAGYPPLVSDRRLLATIPVSRRKHSEPQNVCLREDYYCRTWHYSYQV